MMALPAELKNPAARARYSEDLCKVPLMWAAEREERIVASALHNKAPLTNRRNNLFLQK